MKERIALKTLSKVLELAPSTISKSLSNSSEISAKTKERVKKAVALYDYVPNQHAQNLKFKRGKTIGVVIPTIQINFFSQALESIIYEANKNDFRIIACFSADSSKVERENIDFLIQIQVDGIIISPSNETQISLDITHLNKVKQLEIPMVQFGGVIDKIDCDKISIHDYQEASQATENLILSGKKNSLHFRGSRNRYL